ncbi:MAG: TlpA family protein disulfide reductase [Carboxylicivirga sp.]|jgi:peroxiredoxin|nr:TlpA family protein disulfide reductase [Carboxylicivirga sp.]
MKKITVLMMLTICMQLSVIAQNKQLIFNPNQTSHIHFRVKNLDAARNYSLLLNETLPLRQQIINIELKENGDFTKELNINHPVYAIMYKGKEILEFLLLPNDTLRITLDFSKGKNLKELIEYGGSTASIAEYLSLQKKLYRGVPSQKQSAEEFNQLTDAYCNKELKKLDSLFAEKALPAWFYKLESYHIKVTAADAKSNQYGQRAWMHKQYFDHPMQFDDLALNQTKNNCWLPNNIMYLSGIMPGRFDTLLMQEHVTKQLYSEYLQINFDFVSSKLSGYTLSYYVASKLSSLFYGNKILKLSPTDYKAECLRIDKLISKNKHLITEPEILKFLEEEKQRKYDEYLSQNLLKEGAAAPNFYLKNLEGKTCNLRNYQGKIVLINFWATYCYPCIKTISDKHKLLETFEGKDFVLLNICLDSDIEKWKEIIENKQFKGEHLICKGQWRENISSAYNIYGIPHYTLIGKDGKVIKNNIKEDLAKVIREEM